MNNQIEHLYRGKVPVEPKNAFSGKWVYGDLIHSGDKLYIHPQGNLVKVDGGVGRLIIMHEVIPETVGRYTGLPDKNGTRIFEGDILLDIAGDKEICVVGYWAKGAMYYLDIDNGLYDFADIPSDGTEVIGNVHDTPELLEET